MAARIGPDPSETRATPSRASSATGGLSGIASTLIGQREPLHEGGDRLRVFDPGDEDAVRAGGPIGARAAGGFLHPVEALRGRREEHVRPGVDDDLDPALRAGLAHRADLLRLEGGVDEHRLVLERVLDVQAHRAGVENRERRAPDLLRRAAVPRLHVGRDGDRARGRRSARPLRPSGRGECARRPHTRRRMRRRRSSSPAPGSPPLSTIRALATSHTLGRTTGSPGR